MEKERIIERGIREDGVRYTIVEGVGLFVELDGKNAQLVTMADKWQRERDRYESRKNRVNRTNF